jgi:hypothetical protein
MQQQTLPPGIHCKEDLRDEAEHSFDTGKRIDTYAQIDHDQIGIGR